MKIHLTIIILFPLFCYAQKQGNNWYFGDSAGITFNSVSPTALTNGAIPMYGYSEGTSAISDNLGNVLFYTNGQQIWNRNNQIMPHGDSLLGNFSSTQSSIIIAKPGSSEYFYVFTVDDYWNDHLRYGFRYSIVDMCLDSTLGDVIHGQENILLLDTVAEKVAAVRHSDGIDYWIIIHKLYTNQFYAYLLTANGIVDTVITPIGSVYTYAQGQLKVSSTGNKIAVAADQSYALPCYFELFDFNNTNGTLSNYDSLASPTNSDIYGVEFSPDNSKLYATYGSLSPFGMGIVEYNLNAGGGNQDSINSSMIYIYQNYNTATLRGLQLGPNGKIYQVGIDDAGYLMAINYPNNYGVSCNVQDSAVYLAGKLGSYGLPTFVAGYSYSNADWKCATGMEEINHNQEISIYPNPSTGKFTIQSSVPINLSSVEVFNVFGEQVYCEALNQDEYDNTVDLSNQPAGVYFYRIIEQNGNLIGEGKLIIQK